MSAEAKDYSRAGGRVGTRGATADDLAFLADVFLRSMRPHITAVRGFWDEDKEHKQFSEQLHLNQTQIIHQNGKSIGFFTFTSTLGIFSYESYPSANFIGLVARSCGLYGGLYGRVKNRP